MRGGWVYLMSNRPHGTPYVGVTSDIARRAYGHRTGSIPGFTRAYKLHRPVWFELHDDIGNAIRREKTIMNWPRRWKFWLIHEGNPDWADLFPSLIQ